MCDGIIVVHHYWLADVDFFWKQKWFLIIHCTKSWIHVSIAVMRVTVMELNPYKIKLSIFLHDSWILLPILFPCASLNITLGLLSKILNLIQTLGYMHTSLCNSLGFVYQSKHASLLFVCFPEFGSPHLILYFQGPLFCWRFHDFIFLYSWIMFYWVYVSYCH